MNEFAVRMKENVDENPKEKTECTQFYNFRLLK